MMEFTAQIFVTIELKLIQNKAQQNRMRIYETYYEHDMSYDSKSVKILKLTYNPPIRPAKEIDYRQWRILYCSCHPRSVELRDDWLLNWDFLVMSYRHPPGHANENGGSV